MKTYPMMRAAVIDAADRPNFDRWYETEHLPDAVARFGAERGWCCWSRTDLAVHYAFYEFSDVDRARSVLASPDLQALVADFDRAWGARAARTRDVLETAGVAELNPA